MESCRDLIAEADERDTKAMLKGSRMLLEAICNARGVAAPKLSISYSPPANPALMMEKRRKKSLWPRWYNPPYQASFFPSDIVKGVAVDMGLSVKEVTGRARGAVYVEARAVIATILRKRGMSFPQIGIRLGGRDHSTIINLIDKYPFYLERNPDLHRVYFMNGGVS